MDSPTFSPTHVRQNFRERVSVRVMEKRSAGQVRLCGFFGASLGLCACYAGVDSDASPPGADSSATGGETEDSGDSGNTDADIPEVGCGQLRPGRAPLRRMSDVQYRNTVDDLFEGQVVASEDFPSTSRAFDFSSDPGANHVTDLAAEQLLLAAEDVGDQVIASVEDLAPCPTGDVQVCAESFVDAFGPLVFRRPLEAGRRELLLDVFRAAEAEDGYADGIGRVVTVALQMPEFLYFIEQGADGDDDTLRLSDHEIASRLSYLFWDTMPDDELRELAEAGELQDPDVVEEQARRLLADARSAPALTRFYREWLQIRQLRPADKDAERFDTFGADMIASMDTQLQRFVADSLSGEEPTLTNLLTSNTVQVDGNLAAIYGVSGVEDWTTIEVDPERRAGLLTLPGYLASHSYTEETSAVERGLLIRSRVLCQSIPAPPGDAMDNAPPLPENPTEADRTRALLDTASCGGCHVLMNPLGMGFENYDAIGAWRETYDNGEVIEPRWTLTAPPDGLEEQDFDGAVELTQLLAGSAPVGACFVSNWLHHSYGAQPGSTEVDQCTLDELSESFDASGQDIPSLMLAMTRSDAFRYRDISAEED